MICECYATLPTGERARVNGSYHTGKPCPLRASRLWNEKFQRVAAQNGKGYRQFRKALARIEGGAR